MTPRKVVLIGASGSIGENTLAVLRAHPDKLRLLGVAAGQRAVALAEIVREFDVPHAALADEAAADEAKRNGLVPDSTNWAGGAEAVTALATLPDADIVLVASTGTHGLAPTLAALRQGTDVALANKEVLVLGGPFVVEAAKANKAQILPVDSEHNALYQCLMGQPVEHIQRLILTASGGPFLRTPAKQLQTVRPEDAMQHPNWSMGVKVTIDSATLANKGLELIEARWLFDVEPERLNVVVHPQSIVHGMVELTDGSVLAQLTPPRMTFAIQHVLLHPDRAEPTSATLDWTQPLSLDFEAPDTDRFPALRFAQEALKAGGAAPAIFNAANEIAVAAFIEGGLAFPQIPRVIDHSLDALSDAPAHSLDAVLEADAQARQQATSFIKYHVA